MKVAQEVCFKVDGVDYKLSKLTLNVYQELLDWARSVMPDPFDQLAEKVKGLPDSLAKHLIDRAEERASRRGKLHDPETQDVINSPAGVRKVIQLLMRKYHPTMSEEQCFEVVERGIAEHGEDFFRSAFPQG